MGFPLTEYWGFGGRYTLTQDKITLDQSHFTRTPTELARCPGLRPDQGRAATCATKSATRLTSLIGYFDALR